MCVLAFAWRSHPVFPLVLAGNRDEFHARPTAPAGWWDERDDVVAGRDLQAGGTWMGATRGGRFAIVTNFREPGGDSGDVSRGALVRDFLFSTRSARAWGAAVQPEMYGGFNLIFGDGIELHYLSNRVPATTPLPPGIYGLSNHGLDTPWPKLVRAREGLRSCLARQRPDLPRLFEVLADRRVVDDADLPDTGVPREWERLLSAVFIAGPLYGTRSSTVIAFTTDGSALFEERSFAAGGDPAGHRRIEFRVSDAAGNAPRTGDDA